MEGECYHIYNRGVEKRDIFSDQDDIDRFFLSMNEFNTIEAIGSIYQYSFNKNSRLRTPSPKLVEIVAYCLNPNHFHFILKQVSDKGIAKYMQRLIGGYTNFFNGKYDRTGGLFQGAFKSVHINTDAYFMHLSAYVNLNNRVHQLRTPSPKLVRSSWLEYVSEGKGGVCVKDAVMSHFKDSEQYKKFAQYSIEETISKRTKEKEWKDLLLE